MGRGPAHRPWDRRDNGPKLTAIPMNKAFIDNCGACPATASTWCCQALNSILHIKRGRPVMGSRHLDEMLLGQERVTDPGRGR